MERSQSCRKLATEAEKSVDMRHTLSQPVYLPRSAVSESNTAGTSSNVRSNSEDLRRRIVQLNKELGQERIVVKNLKRDKAMEVRQVRDEEQRRAASVQADLRSKMQKEKMNELTSLKEQLHKEKERDIVQIIKQNDENLRSAQITWAKEKEELRSKIRSEIWSEARDESKREFQKERTKLEQEISDVYRQKTVLEDTLKLVQGADKRKIDDIRRIHHEHEVELEKFKRNSWQESRRQMAEIRQLLNIIEQLEKKLGLEAGYSMRLRLEKDNLYDMLKKTTTFDAWDRIMSSTLQNDQGQTLTAATAGVKGGQELRMLQRKNVELSSLVRKLDEKNQQLATRNAELLAELEKLEKESRDKSRKLERNNADLVQNNKRLETRNRLLLDEINMLKQKKIFIGKKDNSVKPRGQTDKEREELANLRAKLREQAREITDFKESLKEKDRRIELLRGRNKSGNKKTSSASCQSVDTLSVQDDDVMSAHSDFSESSDDIDSRRVRKLAKELLALERAYALLQAHVGSVVDAERDEMERQQLQSDLLQSQARIHELERMINNTGQGGSEEISQLQEDNKALYQKLMLAEKERDQAQEKLSKHSEDLRDLQDQRDLLEFELEEMSQLSVADSGDWDFKRPRSSISVDSLSLTGKEHECSVLSLEEVKTCLEELETEKENMLSPTEQNAIKRARELLDSMAEEITHLQITESALRDKVRDLDLGYNSESLKSELYGLRGSSVVTRDQETLTVLQWAELEHMETTFRNYQLETTWNSRHTGIGLQKENTASMTDLMLEDMENLESVYRNYLKGFPLQGAAGKCTQFDMGKTEVGCMTDLVWKDLVELENMHRERIEGLARVDYSEQHGKDQLGKVDSETMTDLALKELAELGKICPWCRGEKEFTPKNAKDFAEHANNEISLSLNNEEDVVKQKKLAEMGINTDLVWLDLVELENKYLRYMEYMENMESRFTVEKEYMTTLTNDVPVTETKGILPAIVQDTFLEDVRTRDACTMTDTAWNNVVDLENKSIAYRRELEKLQNKLSRFEVMKDEKSSITNISLQDLAILESVSDQMCKSNIELKDAETLTDKVFCEEALPSFVLKTHRSDIETKDECDMTEGIWDEVVELQNTYRDYRRNLDAMKEKLAQFEMEKDDKETITNLAMQDLTDLKNIYKEHLAENDRDGSCSAGQAEKGCMTEVTSVVMSELEGFYINNAASAAVIEKWEQESMTEITSDDMLHLTEVEDLFKQKRPSFGAAADKEEMSTETDLTASDLDYLQNVETAYLDSFSRRKEERSSKHMELRHDTKMAEKGIMTDLTIPDLESLEEVVERCQNTVDKEDQGVITDMTVVDLKYLEDVETAHEECLLDSEDDELKARMCIEETSSVEVMTSLTMADITHLEDVEVAYEECLLDKEEEASQARQISQDRQTSGTMTDLTICDLQDQEMGISRGGTDCKGKENVALMTELTLSDIQCLEDVKSAQEEWFLCRKEALNSSDDGKKDRVEALTDFDVLALKYLGDDEVAYEEGLLVTDEESVEIMQSIESKAKQSVEIMTDLSLSDLKYLEDVEAAHEECLLDKEEEEAKAVVIDVKVHSVDIMTNLTMVDLKYLESVEALHEESLLYKDEVEWKASQIKGQNQDVGTMTDFTASYLPDQELAVATSERRQNIGVGGSKSLSLSFHQENKNTMTEITGDVLDSSCVVTEPERENKEAMSKTIETSDAETITDLTLYANEEFGKLEDFCRVVTEPEKEDKEVMTELTNSELQNLEEVEFLFSEHANHKVDADVMTDLTTADLEYLEEAENVLKMLQSDGNIQKGVVPTEDKEVITNVTSSDVEYLQLLLLEKDAPTFGHQIGNVVEQDDKCTETEITVADIRDLEDQAYAAAKMGATPQVKEKVNEDFQVETMMDLKSELEHLPVFDEPEFIFDEDVEEDMTKGEDVGIMTELRVVDVEHLESLVRYNQNYRATSDGELRLDTNDTGVQCELTDVLMLEEVTRETEQNGGQLPSWFVSALKMGNPIRGNFDPVHLVVRQGDFDQDGDHAETDSICENVAEEAPLFDISDDVSHEREDLPLNSTWEVVSHAPNANANGGEIVTLSEDVGVQCNLADLISVFEYYHRDPREEVVPSWFVSAMNVTRDSSGFDPVQIVLRNRSDPSVCENNVGENPFIRRRHSSNLSIELSRPLVRSTTVNVNFSPRDSLEDDQFENPEAADALLFTSLNASDNVFHETDRSLDPPTDGEERDVIVDMTPNSAVKRFDRFLKERKDSELKNLIALQDLDESFGETKISIALQEENQALKEHIKHLEEETTLKRIEEENELLKQQIEMLKDTVNARELEMENQMLKEKLHILEESPGTKKLEKENDLLKNKVEKADELEEKNAVLKEELASVNELEEENEALKENVQILEETATERRLENEHLKEKIQDLEESTARIVEKLEEENVTLKERVTVLGQSTLCVNDLKEENTLLKEKICDLETISDRQELEQENAVLKEKIRTLEGGSSSEDEFKLLHLKIEQLKEADKIIGALNEANMTLKEKIDFLLLQKKSVRDNSSEMDPTEEPGGVRLLLVQDFGLISSEVESMLGSRFFTSSGINPPLAELSRMAEYFDQADRGVQTSQDQPPMVNREMQTGASIFGTDEDGSIPPHISKELQKLKEENSGLCDEVVELRMELMGRERQVADRVLLMPADEARQTEHAQLEKQISDKATTQVSSLPCDVIRQVPSRPEETITPVIRSTVTSKISDLQERLSHLPAVSSVPVGAASGEEDVDGVDVLVPQRQDEHKKMPSINEGVCHVDRLTPHPDITLVDTVDYQIENEDHGNNQAGVDGLLDLDLDDSEALPPLPDSSPPPLPCAPPPDFLQSSPPVLDHGIEVLLMSESSPLRDAATLRASSRKQSRSNDKASSNSSRASSPVESAEAALKLETEPSKFGALPDSLQFSKFGVVSHKPGLCNEKQDSSVESRPKVPPPTLPKPQRRTMFVRKPGQLSQPFTSLVSPSMASSLSKQWSRDEEDGAIPPQGIVQAQATSLNRREIDALNEKIVFLEKQLTNKESVIRSMKTEATQLETQSLLERKNHEMKILEDDIAFLKQENQKKEKELLTKIGEMNKKSYETEQWKAEANNSERQRQRMEAAYLNLQNQLKSFQGADRKLAELQSKHSGMEKQNWELSEKVKKLERTDTEFKKLEHNIQILQTQVQEMDILEQDRNKLMEKIKLVENQRDDLLRKGRVVESERNDFLRNNKLMELQREELENRCALLYKTNSSLNGRLEELDQDLKQAQTRMHDSQHERNYFQVQLDKLEAERNEFQERLAVVTQERNSLENQVAELQDLNRDHVKLEDAFHTLRIKLAELTREKDEAEMQIPTLKAKISLLKRACKEKEELADRLNEEIRELRHSIATSALDDLSKIRTYGYSPENFVKLSAQRDHELQKAKRGSKDLIEARLKTRLEKSPPPNRKSKPFRPSPPGTKEAKHFVALFDYNPYNSPSSEHPELEVNLREGDYLTVFGDMDINGYFEADVNGVRGLVPSLYVEELEDDKDSTLGLEEHKVHAGTLNNVSPYKGIEEHPVYSDNSDASVVSSSAASEPRQCLVALDDYDPGQSATTRHLALKQVSLKKGDVMTALGDMDANGFYWVHLNDQTGFVPGHLVEELSSSSFPQPSNNRAPEQILRMLDNIPFRDQPQDAADPFTPSLVSSTSYSTHALGDVTSSSHGRHPIRHIPPVGLTRFRPSPEVATLGLLSQYSQATVLAQTSTQPSAATQTVPLMRLQKPATTSLQPAASTQIVPVSNKNQSSRKARPSPPKYLRILRPVNHDAMLVGWTLPELDEYGRSKGLIVKGYKIYANGDVKLDVRSAFMAKALVENLDLRFPIKFSIKTVAENGILSEAVSARFSDTINGDMLNSSGDTSEDSGDDQQYRTVVALYDYDAFKTSPNPNPACELSFKEGDILRVFDTSRKDGFYLGKLKNKKGLIPSNFVEEVAVASPRRLTAAKKQHAARSSPIRPFSRSSSSNGGATSAAAEQPTSIKRKLMVAQYDYNPEKQSPLENIDSELPFKKGQVITVIGEMHGNGFYQADIDGRLGLVPGSFLDDYTNTGTDSGLESGHRVSFEKGRSQRRLEELHET